MTVEQDPHWAASVAWLVQVLRSVGNDATVHALQTAPPAYRRTPWPGPPTSTGWPASPVWASRNRPRS